MTASEIKAGLFSMEAIMSHWVEFNVQSRARNRMTSNADTAIVSPSSWPTHGQIIQWVQTLQAARAAIPDQPT